MPMSRIAIIPARGGSKRIPRKNIKNFLGKPIISYSIESAIQSNLFDEIMVSTDDKEIAAISKDFGAKVPFYRSIKNASDHATTIDVITEVISNYEKRGRLFEKGCCLYPAAPFTTSEKLISFFSKLEEGNFDCVFPVLKYSHPIQRALKLNKDGKIDILNPEHIFTRTQDLEITYHDAGQFYVFDIRALVSQHKLWTPNTASVAIDEMNAQDIDYEEDWEIAEFKYTYLKERNLI